MSAYHQAEVLTVHHWTETLFSFTCTRDPHFRYTNGQFVMIGLEVEGKPLVRAYSMVSANYEDQLEFLSIKVPNGPLTSRLMHIQPGDTVLVGRKPVGTLVVESLTPGKVLYLLATGTGLAPFMAIIRDPDTYERFERVVLVHGCRTVAELAYQDYIRDELPQHDLIGEMVAAQLSYYPTVTREAYEHTGRITDLIRSGKLAADLGLAPLSAADDRVMLCGSPEMLAELKTMVEELGFVEGSSNAPGQFVIEKAFVEK
ncbi:MAG: ferredoxin--NADP reductase [Alphaproteobacteria bacterium]|nr:ferredoxin--NADP reductase [Alphaproteobacteria bacterium]